MYFFLTGMVLLAAIISLIWLKDRLNNPTLARLVHSELVARLAVVGAVLAISGVLFMLSELANASGER